MPSTEDPATVAFIEIADTVPIATTGVPPLEAFLESLKVAWRSTDETRPTAQPKPSKPRYRTVPDPLDAVTDTLKAWFEADPSVTGRQQLERLQVTHPDAYPDNLVRTVQRRLKIWRRESARALVLGCIDTSASGELSGEALRWLTAPHPAGKLPLPSDAPVETVAATALEPQDPGNIPNGDNQRFGEGFLMRVEAARFALARPRPALENLPGWKPRGSWIRLWGKRAVGWGNRCIRGAAEGAHGARYARMHG